MDDPQVPTSNVAQESFPTKSESIEHSEIVSPSMKEEASLRRTFDIFLLPPLALMLVHSIFFLYIKKTSKPYRYLFNALDKGNVGNAETDGWDKVSLLIFC